MTNFSILRETFRTARLSRQILGKTRTGFTAAVVVATRCISTAKASEIVEPENHASATISNDLNAAASGVRQKRNALFSEEKERQERLLTKIDKIEVNVIGPPNGIDCKLMMNKHVSTPLHCAMHINQSLTKYAALALINNKVLWDMNRPLTENCQIQYLFFTDADPLHVNQAYWRSCSFVLGYILETAFKNQYTVNLHSWPSSNFRTGSFIYDAQLLNVGDWTPSQDELRILSKIPASNLRAENWPFDPLDVDIAVAAKIFEDSPFKSEQLRYMAKSNKKIRLYRVGEHVDISKGPMISHTSQLGIYSVTAFHPFDSDFGRMHRVQGVSVPFTQHVNSWTWEIVCRSAKRQNSMPFPCRRRYENQVIN